MQRKKRLRKRHEAIARAQRVRQRLLDFPRRGKRRRDGVPHDLLRKPLHERVNRHNAGELRIQGGVQQLRAPAAVHPAAGNPFLPGGDAARAVGLVVPDEA